MKPGTEQLEITDVPPYVRSWSVVCLPGFVVAALTRWQRDFGKLPGQFALVACPQAEINDLGGLPLPVIEATDARVRMKHFTSCNRLYTVILLLGEDAEERRAQIQQHLPWSEGYQVEYGGAGARLQFVEAVEN